MIPEQREKTNFQLIATPASGPSSSVLPFFFSSKIFAGQVKYKDYILANVKILTTVRILLKRLLSVICLLFVLSSTLLSGMQVWPSGMMREGLFLRNNATGRNSGLLCLPEAGLPHQL